MKHQIHVRICSFIAASVAALFSQTALTQSLDCIEGQATPELIGSWRQVAADGLQSGSLSAATVAQKIGQCFPEVPKCMVRLSDYAKRNDNASSLDDLSINDLAQKQPPSEFLVPGSAELKYLFPTDIEKIAKEKGWPTVRYKSRHAGGFDSDTPSLLMVYVPGDKVNPPVGYDRWLNFALPKDTGADELTPLPQAAVPGAQDYADELAGTKDLPRTFTMVTLDRRTASSPAQVYFQMFTRETTGSAVFTPRSNSSVSSCVSCHPNGLRAISPLGYHVRQGEEQLPEEAWKTVELINAAMESAAGDRVVSWREVASGVNGDKKPLLSPHAHGPEIGPRKPLNGISRSKEFILGGTLPDGRILAGCYKSRNTVNVTDIFGRAPGKKNIYTLSTNPTIDWEKVSDAMNCASCHNNRSRGALNELTDYAQIDFKILVDQSMPLGAHVNPLEAGDAQTEVTDDLTADERIALANCLQEEFELEQQELAKWLTATSCQ